MPLNRQNSPGFFSNPFSGFESKLAESAAATQALNAAKNPASAPPMATAAVTATATQTFTGLCEALNTHQKQLVSEGRYEKADVYEIIFFPPELAGSTVKKPGPTDQSQTTMQNKTPDGSELLPSKNSMNTNSRTIQATAGTQIVQFIDQVMKGSSYISDQQTVIVDANGKVTPTSKSTPGQTAWYKINLQATPIPNGWDNQRRDYAYKMTFMITPYAINNMQSEYFPKSRFRGLHKSYNYWFTGDNTQVLDFQQEYNNLYRLIISGNGIPPDKATSDNREITRRTYMAASEQSSQGAEGYVNEPAANAADYLYSPSDQAKVKLKIVGDPAWLQQGEVAGINPNQFTFQPFNNDGTINYDASEIVFDINFNRPADYNTQTGIIDVNANNTIKNQPQENLTYTAIKCRSSFSKGRFEQELEGRLLIEYFDTDNPKASVQGITQDPTQTGGTTTTAPLTAASVARQLGLGTANPANLPRSQQAASASIFQNLFGSNSYASARARNLSQTQAADGRITTSSPTADPATASGSASAPPLTAAPPPEPVTSNGEVTGYQNEAQQIADGNGAGAEYQSQFMDRET